MSLFLHSLLLANLLVAAATGESITTVHSQIDLLVAAKNDCDYPQEQLDAVSKWDDAGHGSYNAGSAHWGQIAINEAMKTTAAGRSVHVRANCATYEMLAGPLAVYELIRTGAKGAALRMAKELAAEWQEYHSDATLDAVGRSDYEQFPDEITHAVYYNCTPAGPFDSCPWPSPAAVIRTTMRSLGVDWSK